MQYIQAAKEEPDDAGCVFCVDRRRPRPSASSCTASSPTCVLNKFPYNPGHLLVRAAPPRRATWRTLTPEENAEHRGAAAAIARARSARTSDPAGFNVGLNLGRVAGAGIPGHLHWHVVPRWSGDTNFMPVVGRDACAPRTARGDVRAA